MESSQGTVNCPTYLGTNRHAERDGYVVPILSARPRGHLPNEALMLGKEDADEIGSQSSEEWQDAQEYLFSAADVEQARSLPRLTTLPGELVLLIMRHLTPGSLWSFRQSSPRFMRLFETGKTFKRYHDDPQSQDPYLPFKVEAMSNAQRRIASRFIRRDRERKEEEEKFGGYCASCVEVLKCGECDPKKMRLRETRYCYGCKRRHMCVFFTPKSIEQYDGGTLAELHCVGRTEKVALCSHELATPLTWANVEGRSIDGKLGVSCEHVSHRPTLGDERTWHKEHYPHFSAKEHPLGRGFSIIEAGWERPLLDIDPENPPTLEDMRKAMEGLLEGAFLQIKPCQHMSNGQQLREFVHAGTCKCFCDPNIHRRFPRHEFWIPLDSWDSPNDDVKKTLCSCSRKEYLECRECASTYAWLLECGRITLSYRYTWGVMQPTCYGWLNLLAHQRGPKGLGMLGEENRHLLWCEEPGCNTGMGRRWQEMVMEAIWLQDALHQKKVDKDGFFGVVMLWDQHGVCRLRRKGNNHCFGGFEPSPFIVEVSNTEEGKLLLAQVKEAADAARDSR